MKYRNLIASVLMIGGLFAQSINGTITDVDNKPLEGANIVVLGTDLGGVSDNTGAFSIDVSNGTYDITASFIGYSSITKSIVVEGITTLNFVLDFDVVSLSDVEVLASRASETTPVAYTNVDKEEMELRLGSQDIPMILNTTPSVYAT